MDFLHLPDSSHHASIMPLSAVSFAVGSCQDLWGRNLRPLTDWSLLQTVPTDESVLTVQPGVQGSV
jgi:hypothetical protein